MPSKKPLIGLRLSKQVHERLIATAAADSRTPTNYIEQLLKRTFGMVLLPAAAPRQATASTPAARPSVPANGVAHDPRIAADAAELNTCNHFRALVGLAPYKTIYDKRAQDDKDEAAAKAQEDKENNIDMDDENGTVQ